MCGGLLIHIIDGMNQLTTDAKIRWFSADLEVGLLT